MWCWMARWTLPQELRGMEAKMDMTEDSTRPANSPPPTHVPGIEPFQVAFFKDTSALGTSESNSRQRVGAFEGRACRRNSFKHSSFSEMQ